MDVTRKVVRRLIISGVIFVVLLILTAVTFYYFYARLPIVPLMVGLTGWLPAAVMLMSLNDLRLIKVKKSSQSHQPPNRS